MKKLFFYIILLIGHSSFGQENLANCLDSLKGPSSFTPNGDGKNDLYSIDFPCVPEKIKISILNRWGQEIYTSKYPGFQWDGKDADGNKIETGVYHYYIEYTYLKKKKTVQGSFTLIR